MVPYSPESGDRGAMLFGPSFFLFQDLRSGLVSSARQRRGLGLEEGAPKPPHRDGTRVIEAGNICPGYKASATQWMRGRQAGRGLTGQQVCPGLMGAQLCQTLQAALIPLVPALHQLWQSPLNLCQGGRLAGRGNGHFIFNDSSTFGGMVRRSLFLTLCVCVWSLVRMCPLILCLLWRATFPHFILQGEDVSSILSLSFLTFIF